MTSSSDALAPWNLPELDGRGPGLSAVMPVPLPTVPDGGLLLPDLEELPAPGDTSEIGAATVRTALEDAYLTGVEDGRRQGAAEAETRARPALEALARVADHLEATQAEFARQRARNLHGLAMAVAERIIQREVMTDPGIVRDLVEKALELLPQDASVEVRLNPEDLSLLEKDLQRFAAPERALSLQWTGDPGLARGGFLVESPARVIDGRTDVALRNLYERLDHE